MKKIFHAVLFVVLAIGANAQSTPKKVTFGNASAVTSINGETGDVTGYSKPTSTETLSNKTISGATNTISNVPQNAVDNLVTNLADKVAVSVFNTHANSTSNPHSVTSTQVGLGNVPNVNATLRSNHTGTQPPTSVTEDATHRWTTDTEKALWNANSGGFITSYSTSGTSGPASVVAGNLNIPQYTGSVGGYGDGVFISQFASGTYGYPNDGLYDDSAFWKACRYVATSGTTAKTNRVLIDLAGTYDFECLNNVGVPIGFPEIAFTTIVVEAMPSVPFDIAGTMKGVTFQGHNPNYPIVNFQAARGSQLIGVNVIGVNDINVNPGEGQEILTNYLDLEYGNSLIDRDLPQVGVSVDLWAGDGETEHPDGVAHTAAASSRILIKNCNIKKNGLGLGVQVFGRADGNGDFVSCVDVAFEDNTYHAASGNSQCRQFNFYNSYFDRGYCGVTTGVFGKQQGRVNMISGGHSSNFQMINITDMAMNGDLSFYSHYTESQVEIGYAGYDNTSSARVWFYGCDINLSHQQSRIIPRYVFKGDKIGFVGGRLYGANIDFDVLSPPIMIGTALINIRDNVGAYDRVENRQQNEQSWIDMYHRIPQMLGTATYQDVSQSEVIYSNYVYKWDKTNAWGSMAYRRPDLENVPIGTSGLASDPLYKSKTFSIVGNLGVDNGLVNRSLDSNRMLCTINASQLEFFVPHYMQRGDILYFNDTKIKFRIVERGTLQADTVNPSIPGDDLELVLLNGFKWTSANYFRGYTDGLTSTTLLGTKMTWYSGNIRQRRLVKGATTSSSGTITGVDYSFTATDNPGFAGNQFVVGDMVHLYGYSGAETNQQTKMHTAKVTAINSGAGTMTVDPVVPYTSSSVIIFSKKPTFNN